MQFWTVVRIGQANGGLVLAGPQQPPMLFALCIAVEEGQSPEQAACGAGMWPYCYIRPATTPEVDALLVAHPELAPPPLTLVPEAFLRADQ